MGVLGIDGWRGGWVGIRLDGRDVRAVVARTLAELAELAGPVEMVGIDIPLHLPEGPDPRPAEVAARKDLKRRASTLFTTMHIDCLAAADYPEANLISSARSGRRISKQAWNLAPRIREAREIVAVSATPLVEVHPELSFLHMAGTGEALPAKKTWAGQAQRLAALFEVGVELDGLADEIVGAVPVDDVLDAAAVAWSATRILAGTAVVYPPTPDGTRDALANDHIWA